MSRTTKADEIALVIEDAIIGGDLMPGTILRQEQLSEELGVSRTPVREALRQVAALGLVTLEANRGVRVRMPSPAEFQEAFRIRAELEGLAAELAVPQITRQELARLRAAEETFARATQDMRNRGQDPLELRRLAGDWVRANDEFHDLILSAANAPLLERMARSVRRVFYGQVSWSDSPEVDAQYGVNVSQHRAIVKAFEERDPAVRELVVQHVLDSGRLLEGLLSQTVDRSPKLLAGRSLG